MSAAAAAPAASAAPAAVVPSVAEIMGDDVARIYEAKNKLSAAASNPILMSGELPTYQIILAAVKGSEQVKVLTADYLPQFLHFFPTLVETGINAQLDLVEDEKAVIRLHAIRGLEMICKNNASTVRRIAEVLGQLLVSEEKLELACVQATFASLFKIDPQQSFNALFPLIGPGFELNTRTKGLEFLQAQLKAHLPTIRKDEAASAAVAAGLKSMLSVQNTLLGRDELRSFVQTLLTLTPHHGKQDKIKADDVLRGELTTIALAQSGLATGSLDLGNEAALRHYLAVQNVVSNLTSQYGVDATPFVTVYFQQILPNLELVASADLRTQLLRAGCSSASKLTPKQAQTFFSAFFEQFKKYVPTGEIVAKAAPAPAAAATSADAAAPAAAATEPAAASAVSSSPPVASLNFVFAEVFVYLFHILAPLAPTELRAATGIFTPTGQPGDFADAASPLKEEFYNRVAFLLQSNAQYKEQLLTVRKRLDAETKQFAQNNRTGAKGKGKPAAAAPATTGQPGAAAAESKKEDAEMSPEPSAAAAAEPAADNSAVIATLRSQTQSVNLAVRVANAIEASAKPLQHKPLPTFVPADKINLSWRNSDNNKAPQGGKQAPKQQQQGGKGQQQQQQQGGRGQQQQQQQQKQKQGGQKRKSDGGQQQSQSNKKQGGGNAQSNKKQNGGGNQQQQGGQQPSKKQKQSQSNKGGNQQNGNGNQNGGGRRRR